MRTLLGVFLILCGVIIGLYLGVWVMFVGGIIDLINQFKAPELNAMRVAIGIVKIVFANFVGWLSAMIFIFPGFAMIDVEKIQRRSKWTHQKH